MRKERHKGTLARAALKAGMSEKTARKYLKQTTEEKISKPSIPKPNPFEKHWQELTERLDKAPELQAQTLMTYLVESYPDLYKPGQIRSLQRRLKAWKAYHGADKPVIFRQTLKAGRQSQSDWTHMGSLNITINGEPFPHLLFHYLLPYSGFETFMICESESFETLTKGFEHGVFESGGVAVEHRTDNLTAATQKMGNDRIFTKRWLEFLAHYHVQPSRNNPGVSHENGSIEKSHHTFKTAVDQHLWLRRSRDFNTIEAYHTFLTMIKTKRNFARRAKIAEEIDTLRELPEKRFYEATLLHARVSPSSTIQVLGVTYSVPSRLVGLWLKVSVCRDSLDLIYAQTLLLTLPRLEAGVFIDYRHIIDSLLRKPGAFESYQYRSFLYPNPTFRRAYDVLKSTGLTSCTKRYLELLHTAKIYGENEVSLIIDGLLNASQLPLKTAVCALLTDKKPHPSPHVDEPQLASYDQLIASFAQQKQVMS